MAEAMVRNLSVNVPLGVDAEGVCAVLRGRSR